MADIEQDIKLIGMGDTIEIWSNGKVGEQQLTPEAFEAALEELMSDNGQPDETAILSNAKTAPQS
jgi:MraZ protein